VRLSLSHPTLLRRFVAACLAPRTRDVAILSLAPVARSASRNPATLHEAGAGPGEELAVRGLAARESSSPRDELAARGLLNLGAPVPIPVRIM
jgi:hypothetical protein